MIHDALQTIRAALQEPGLPSQNGSAEVSSKQPCEHSGVVETATQAWHAQISQFDGHAAAVIHCSVKKRQSKQGKFALQALWSSRGPGVPRWQPVDSELQEEMKRTDAKAEAEKCWASGRPAPGELSWL